MNILVRLPNWLGDLVMSTAFVNALQQQYPGAAIDVIVKKSLQDVADVIPGIGEKWLFEKKEWKGLQGAYRFGKMISSKKKYDLFFCLPDSLSSAVMGLGTGVRERIGYNKELRGILLTHKYRRPVNVHRVEEYICLLELFAQTEVKEKKVALINNLPKISNRIIVNFNSEASSRRMPLEKAISVLKILLNKFTNHEFVFIGAPNEKPYVDSILEQLPATTNRYNNLAGATTLKELLEIIASAALMLTTDSGPAHVAHALQIKTIVLFGAGNEKNTAPYHLAASSIIRNGPVECEPCVKNTCKFGEPKCLLLLHEVKIAETVTHLYKETV
jgi:lipopolysaccharide heptosyltransferase II